MSDYHEHHPHEQLEKYLDGLLQGEELAEFKERLSNESDLQHAVERQRALEERLRKTLTPVATTAEEIFTWIGTPVEQDARSKLNRRSVAFAALMAIAAVVGWFIIVTQWNGGTRHVEPFFEQRPLVSLYQETVDQGFRPYYFCQDEDRFAQTFRKRQDVPLALEMTPVDRHMVGLSYIGGLSRDTTAMLAYVEAHPVVVFVDRKEFDNEQLATETPTGSKRLHVHRSELGELVMYEVSPFDTAKMSPYLSIDE